MGVPDPLFEGFLRVLRKWSFLQCDLGVPGGIPPKPHKPDTFLKLCKGFYKRGRFYGGIWVFFVVWIFLVQKTPKTPSPDPPKGVPWEASGEASPESQKSLKKKCSPEGCYLQLPNPLKIGDFGGLGAFQGLGAPKHPFLTLFTGKPSGLGGVLPPL